MWAVVCGLIERLAVQRKSRSCVLRGRGGTNAHVRPLVRNFLHVIVGSGWLLKERFVLDEREVIRPF